MSKFVASNLDESSFFFSFNVKSIKKILDLIPPKPILQEYESVVGPLMCDLKEGIHLEGILREKN